MKSKLTTLEKTKAPFYESITNLPRMIKIVLRISLVGIITLFFYLFGVVVN